MRTPRAAAVLALLLAVPAFSQQPSPCVAAYQQDWAAVWELKAQAWAALCAKDPRTQLLLERAQRAFIERCGEQAKPVVDAKKIDRDSALALCAQGVPGRARIPGLGAQPGAAGAADPGAPGAPDAALVKGGKQVGALGARISSRVSSDVAALYGERTLNAGAANAGGVLAKAAPEKKTDGSDSSSAPNKGLKVNPVPEKPYEPSDAKKAPYLKTLDSRFSADGVSPEVARTSRAMYRGVVERLSPDILKNLVDANSYVVIIPKDKALTDVPPFTTLKGKKTFDGRVWDGVRGVSDVSDGKGNTYTAVPEENYLPGNANGLTQGYAQFYTFAHEFGHAVMNHGLPQDPPPPAGFWEGVKRKLWGDPPSRREVEEIYNESMRRKEKTGLGPYADANPREFYGEAVGAYFGADYEAGTFETSETLKAANPKMYALMARIYGPPDAYMAPKKK